MGLAAGIVGAGALSAGASLIGSSNAASAQEQAAQTASNTQLQMFGQEQQNLAPYMAAGTNAQSQLTNQLTTLSAPITMNEAQLQQTPGYQFNLQQGQRQVQNTAAARGLGVSGAEMKGAASYATGLADNTYQNQFNNAQTNRQTTYNMLSGQQSLGENAAAGVGNAGIATGNQIAQNTIGAGNASAAASMAGANGVAAGGNSIASGYLMNSLINNGGLYGGSATGTSAINSGNAFENQVFNGLSLGT